MPRVKSQSVPLKKWRHNYAPGTCIDWTHALPFFLNPRGVLVHRVRSARTYLRDGEHTHGAVEYWCGNSCCFELIGSDKMFLAEPPEDRLLCTFCEAKAVAKDQPKADKLAGRHCHVGVLRAHRVCCNGADHN